MALNYILKVDKIQGSISKTKRCALRCSGSPCGTPGECPKRDQLLGGVEDIKVMHSNR